MNKSQILLWTVVFGIFFTIVGCGVLLNRKEKTEFNNYNAMPHIENIGKGVKATENIVKNGTEIIIKDARDIRTNADRLEATLPFETRPSVQAYIDTIKSKSENQITEAEKLYLESHEKLRDVAIELQSARGKLIKQGNILDIAIKERDEAYRTRNEALKERDEALGDQAAATRKMLIWVMIGGIGIVALGGVMAFYGQLKTGLSLAVGGGIVVALSIMISQYLEWIALGMLVLVVAAIAYLIYQYAIKDKALDEVVTTAEMAKRRLNPADRREVFGYREDKGLAGTAQSKTTIEQVLKSREKMRPQWEHTYNDKDAQDMDEVEAEVRKASI